MALRGLIDFDGYAIRFYTSVLMPRTSTAPRPPATAEIHVARRLAALRAESGLTLRALAERTGLSDAYLAPGPQLRFRKRQGNSDVAGSIVVHRTP